MKKNLLALLLIILGAQASAAVVTLGANGTGWCASGGGCNNSNIYIYENNDLANSINNWQSFTLGTGTITAATLSIYESGSYPSFYEYGNGDINFYIASGLNFAGLQNGPSIGTIVNGAAEPTNAYVNIALNSYGIQQLNLLQGQSFVIGGSNGGSQVDAFGFSGNGFTPAPYLTLNDSPVAAAVPEPGTIALFGLGLFGLTALRRRSTK